MFVYHFNKNCGEYKIEFKELGQALEKAYDDIRNSPNSPRYIVDTKENKVIRTAMDIANLYKEKYHKGSYVPRVKFKSKMQVTYTLTFRKTLYTNDMKKTLEELSKREDCGVASKVHGSFNLIESQELYNLF